MKMIRLVVVGDGCVRVESVIRLIQGVFVLKVLQELFRSSCL